MTSKPWYHNGLRFGCTQCGNCCTSHGEYSFVYLQPAEVERIAHHLGLERDVFLARYCSADGERTTLRMDDPACPFLTPDKRCAIYPVRPKQCATWPFWPENLEQATWEGPVSTICPGIGQGTHYSAEAIERIARDVDREDGD